MTVTGNYDRYESLFIELEQARLEMLQADSAVAKAKRAFHDEGVALSAAALHTLYADQNAKSIKVQELKIQAMQAKQEAKRLKNKTFTAKLIEKVEAAGLNHLVAEAAEESLQAITDAGLRGAYSA